MSVATEIPIPCRFDTAIGYWTGEPDWDWLRQALLAARAAPQEQIDAWLEAVCADSSTPPALAAEGGISVRVDGHLLSIAGPAAACQALALNLRTHLSR